MWSEWRATGQSIPRITYRGVFTSLQGVSTDQGPSSIIPTEDDIQRAKQQIEMQHKILAQSITQEARDEAHANLDSWEERLQCLTRRTPVVPIVHKVYRWFSHFLADTGLDSGVSGDVLLPPDDSIGGGIGTWRQYIGRELRILGFPECALHAIDARTIGQLTSSVAKVADALGMDP